MLPSGKFVYKIMIKVNIMKFLDVTVIVFKLIPKWVSTLDGDPCPQFPSEKSSGVLREVLLSKALKIIFEVCLIREKIHGFPSFRWGFGIYKKLDEPGFKAFFEMPRLSGPGLSQSECLHKTISLAC